MRFSAVIMVALVVAAQLIEAKKKPKVR